MDRQSPMGQLKRAFGGNVKRPPSNWILHVKSYAQKIICPIKIV
jgi:hypothetical protein